MGIREDLEAELRAADEEYSRLYREHERLKRKLAEIRQVAGMPTLDDKEARNRIIGIFNEP